MGATCVTGETDAPAIPAVSVVVAIAAGDTDAVVMLGSDAAGVAVLDVDTTSTTELAVGAAAVVEPLADLSSSLLDERGVFDRFAARFA